MVQTNITDLFINAAVTEQEETTTTDLKIIPPQVSEIIIKNIYGGIVSREIKTTAAEPEPQPEPIKAEKEEIKTDAAITTTTEETKKEIKEIDTIKARLNAIDFKNFFSVLCGLHSEIRINFNQYGLNVIEMDPANIEMSILNLKNSAFMNYEINNNFSIGINLNQLKPIFKSIKKFDNLWIEKDAESNKLKISIMGKITQVFNIPLLNLEDKKEQQQPDLSHTISAEINADEFKTAIDAAVNVSESLLINLKRENLELSAEGDINNFNTVLGSDFIRGNESAACKYSLEYLKKMIMPYKFFDKVKISVRNDYPIIFEYSADYDKFNLTLILAPRNEND